MSSEEASWDPPQSSRQFSCRALLRSVEEREEITTPTTKVSVPQISHYRYLAWITPPYVAGSFHRPGMALYFSRYLAGLDHSTAPSRLSVWFACRHRLSAWTDRQLGLLESYLRPCIGRLPKIPNTGVVALEDKHFDSCAETREMSFKGVSKAPWREPP